MQVQINCPYFKTLILNNVPHTACMGLKQMLAANNIQHFCFGPGCPLPFIKDQEPKP